MPVFTRRINEKVTKAAQGKKARGKATEKAIAATKLARQMLARDIESDPTSIKIESDPETIGFFGFKPDDQPVDNLKNSIDERIEINEVPKMKKSKDGASFAYTIKYPTVNQIYADSNLNLPWITQTWVEKVQRGIGNIELFLFYPGKGVSEFGIQGKVPKDPKFSNGKSETPDPQYLERIRGNFSENLTKAGLKTK